MLSVQTNKQLMFEAENDNNTKNATNNNQYFINRIKYIRCYFETLKIKRKILMYPTKEK